MDVDLSTDLRALLPLIAGLVSGHSDVAIGSRLAPGARTVCSRKRELISRAYNRLLHAALRARFSDAQCGFKSIRADVARRLLPGVEDEGWFFDTELRSAADCGSTRWRSTGSRTATRGSTSSPPRSPTSGGGAAVAGMPVARFVAIGVLSSAVYAVLYLMLRISMGPGAASALALGCTEIANTQANRRYTFGVRGRQGLLRQRCRRRARLPAGTGPDAGGA